MLYFRLLLFIRQQLKILKFHFWSLFLANHKLSTHICLKLLCYRGADFFFFKCTFFRWLEHFLTLTGKFNAEIVNFP